MTATALADRLDDEHRRIDELVTADLDVRASLEVGYQQLDPEAARLLGLLGVMAFPTFTPRLCAALLDVQPAHAERSLDSLSANHLVSAVDVDRYRMHDLVRLHARQRAHASEPAAALHAAVERVCRTDRKSTRLNSSHPQLSRMPSSA